jgi:hypothetical protein
VDSVFGVLIELAQRSEKSSGVDHHGIDKLNLRHSLACCFACQTHSHKEPSSVFPTSHPFARRVHLLSAFGATEEKVNRLLISSDTLVILITVNIYRRGGFLMTRRAGKFSEVRTKKKFFERFYFVYAMLLELVIVGAWPGT